MTDPPARQFRENALRLAAPSDSRYRQTSQGVDATIDLTLPNLRFSLT